MAQTANQVAAPAAPVAPVASAVETLCGKPVEQVSATIVEIGFQSSKAESKMAEGKQALDVCDANLLDWIRDQDYASFMRVREFYVTGAVDAGKTTDAADQQWVRAINRLVSNAGFVRPKSESKDAQRKAEQKAKEIEALAEFGDGALLEQKAALLAKGDAKSLREALKLDKEVQRRNKDALDVEATHRKAVLDKIISRAKELAKAGTADADAALNAALLALG